MILYFSGTGNSRYAAEQIGKILKDTVVSINERMKKGDVTPLYSETPYVVVSPVYAWRVPRIVEQFIEKAIFNGNKKIYFVLTCGQDVGAASRYAQKLCVRKGLDFCGLTGIPMPENYITMFRAPGREECKKIVLRAGKPIEHAAAWVRKGKSYPAKRTTIGDFLKSGVINVLFYPLFISAKGFYTTDACNGCGTCVKLCPLKNIRLEDKRPVWGDRCTQCMACIGGCPKTAVEYKNKTKGKERYYFS